MHGAQAHNYHPLSYPNATPATQHATNMSLPLRPACWIIQSWPTCRSQSAMVRLEPFLLQWHLNLPMHSINMRGSDWSCWGAEPICPKTKSPYDYH